MPQAWRTRSTNRQALRRQIGEHRYHQTASEHDRGQNQRRANKHGCPFDGDGWVLVRSLLVPQPVKEMYGGAETQSEGDRQRGCVLNVTFNYCALLR
jgi:hypothetical protein